MRQLPTGGERGKSAAKWPRRQGRRLLSTRTSCQEGCGMMRRKEPILRRGEDLKAARSAVQAAGSEGRCGRKSCPACPRWSARWPRAWQSLPPSEGAESGGKSGWHLRWSGEPGMEGILIMDYWMVLPVIVMLVTGLIMRIQRHLSEVWKPLDDGPILARVGEANLPIDGGGTASKK
jgi:hypothetical protein